MNRSPSLKSNLTSSRIPLIGVTTTLLPIESGPFMGLERTAVVRDYIASLERAGGASVTMPVVDDERYLTRCLEAVDGVLLTGGFDLLPLLYKEEPIPGLDSIDAERDAYELTLVKCAIRARKPVFGICRGMQVLTVALGGALYQDLQSASRYAATF